MTRFEKMRSDLEAEKFERLLAQSASREARHPSPRFDVEFDLAGRLELEPSYSRFVCGKFARSVAGGKS